MNEPTLNASSSRPGTSDMALALGISPSGRIHLDMLAHESGQIAPAVAARIGKAFEAGSGSGLLHLGASELASAQLPVPQAELDQLAARMPPMRGAEYLDRARHPAPHGAKLA